MLKMKECLWWPFTQHQRRQEESKVNATLIGLLQRNTNILNNVLAVETIKTMALKVKVTVILPRKKWNVRQSTLMQVCVPHGERRGTFGPK